MTAMTQQFHYKRFHFLQCHVISMYGSQSLCHSVRMLSHTHTLDLFFIYLFFLLYIKTCRELSLPIWTPGAGQTDTQTRNDQV